MGGRVLTGRAAAPVRRAVAVESGRLAALLARAFHDDPVLGWVVPRDDRRPAVGRRIFALRLKHINVATNGHFTHTKTFRQFCDEYFAIRRQLLSNNIQPLDLTYIVACSCHNYSRFKYDHPASLTAFFRVPVQSPSTSTM